MDTKVLNLQDYTNYIKCGEILKSPLPNYQHPFVLRCYQCDKINFMLEAFVLHIQEHCGGIASLQEFSIETVVSGTEVERECIENPEIKTEAIDMETDDPLIGVKCEIDIHVKKENVESDNQFDDSGSNTENSESDDDDDMPNKPIKKGRKSSLSPAIEEFTRSRENMKILIELYKNQPNLWNKELPTYRFRHKKQGYVEEICKDLNNKLNSNYTWREVLDIIRYIFKKHREDFKRLRSYEEDDKNQKDIKYKFSWFYDDLYFLRPKSVIELQKLDTNLPDLSTEQVIQIIEIYRDHPHLWNCNLIEYICSNKRQEALVEMSKSLEENMNLKVDEKTLEEYIRSVHSYFSNEKRLRIQNSTKEFKSPFDEYYKHLLFLYEHEGPFHCSSCKKIFLKPLGFRVHRSNHDESIPLICSVCNKEFRTIPAYTVHAKRHFEDLNFACDICNKKFLAYADLKVHSLTHSGDKPYCCEKCGASYRYIHGFKRHHRRHEKKYTHQCTICSKGYYSKERYDDHINSHLNIRSHICRVCGKGFITNRALKTHSVTHEDARNHACKLCGKTFKLKIGVLQHMRTHATRVELEDKQ